MSAPLEERFWKKVRVLGPDACWEWNGGRCPKYGSVWDGTKTQRASRVAWMLTNGPIPDGMLVCHACDNPPCVNPSHLFLGTHRDNALDRDAKGRSRKGRLTRSATHCAKGHEYTASNTVQRSDGGRQCRACVRENRRDYYHRNREECRAYQNEWARKHRVRP